MNDIKTDQNTFWKEINQNQLSPERIENEFSSFKSSSVNHKIALFNPEVNGVRYLKTLIYVMAAALTDEKKELLKSVKNRSLGEPISINYNSEDVCLDYLQAVEELFFISSNFELNGKKILEIGAGYGRTAHTILSNCALQEYTIVDLDNALGLSKKYLKEVLSGEQFGKIKFVAVSDFESIKNKRFDLAINIDSFAEMDKEVVLEYLKYINTNCLNFYVKNPVGKYLDKSLDGHSQGNEVIELALRQGILTDIIDIDNQQAIVNASKKFTLSYLPSKEWLISGDAWAPPFSYLWQAFYSHEQSGK